MFLLIKMFKTLDIIFPEDITNYILGFISDKYIIDPNNHKRIYHRKTCKYNLPIPKHSFRQAVWRRRYYNPHNPEGIKLEAYKHTKLPKKRLSFILGRSYKKFKFRVECKCVAPPNNNAHWFEHWMDEVTRKIRNGDQIEVFRKGWDISVPMAITVLVNDYGPRLFDVIDRIQRENPNLQWSIVDRMFWDIRGNLNTIHRGLHHSFINFLPRL